MKKVITYGTFDLLHEGHINLLRRAKSLGDFLIVGISSDEFNKIKGKKAYQDLETRKKVLEGIKYVDKVIIEKSWDQKINDIKKYNVDIFVMGDDWKGKFDYLEKYCKVVYLPRTKGISSTMIRNNIDSMFNEKVNIVIKSKENNLKNIVRKILMRIRAVVFMVFFYFLSYIVKKEKGLYVFGSMDGKSISGNSKAIFEFYKKQKDKKCFYITQNKDIVNGKDIIYVSSFDAIKYVLKAEYIFTDSSALSVSPSLALLGKFNIVRLWHGEPIKKINFDSKKVIKSIGAIGAFLLKNEYKNNVIIPVCSGNTQKVMNSAFLCKCAKITGLPRNDIFFKEEKKDILEKVDKYFNISQYKKIFLYAPTWRDTNSKIKPFTKELFKRLNLYLKENNYLLIIAGHIQTEKIFFDETSNVKDFDRKCCDIQELLVATDVLITDYSSIYIDFLLTNKPIIFYAYDLEDYLSKDRELYFNYYDVVIKDTLVKNEYDFLDTLKTIDLISNSDSYKTNYKKIKSFFHKYQNGGYCKRLDKCIDNIKV